MRTVVLGPRPPELEALIERRQRLGLDGRDEVWDGEYHMAPAAHSWHGFAESQIVMAFQPHVQRAGLIQTGSFNLGESSNYRIPDAGVFRDLTDSVWVPTALLVVEILSSDDESFAKLPFYAAHGVREVVMVDVRAAQLRWLAVTADGSWADVEHSDVLDVDAADVVAAMTWPR